VPCELAALLALPVGPDFGMSYSALVEYLPALERYSGNLYQAANIRIDDVRLFHEKQPIIISALYGVVLPQELIRDYNVSMSTRLPSGIRTGTWWRGHRLGDLMGAVAKHLGATDTYDLLSEDYRSALAPWPHGAYAPHYQRPDFGKVGQGINYHRGKDLRRLVVGE
jgi:cytoplasmic iron level regulating protein YaaA (DUF328/UPF0246 family)